MLVSKNAKICVIGARIGHVHFIKFVSISFAFGSQHKRGFQWNMGFRFSLDFLRFSHKKVLPTTLHFCLQYSGRGREGGGGGAIKWENRRYETFCTPPSKQGQTSPFLCLLALAKTCHLHTFVGVRLDLPPISPPIM